MSERFYLSRHSSEDYPLGPDGNVLVDSADGRELGRDFGFPREDALLTRAWAWVPRELNALAAQLSAAEAEAARLREGADRLVGLLPALRDAARAAGQRVRRCKERERVLRELESAFHTVCLAMASLAPRGTRVPVGTPGVRDAGSPCGNFEPGEPDGHC